MFGPPHIARANDLAETIRAQDKADQQNGTTKLAAARGDNAMIKPKLVTPITRVRSTCTCTYCSITFESEKNV